MHKKLEIVEIQKIFTMRDRKHSQSAISERLGISKSTVCQYLKNRKKYCTDEYFNIGYTIDDRILMLEVELTAMKKQYAHYERKQELIDELDAIIHLRGVL